MKTALYPGSFDPITNGHLDVLHRATHIFDKVVIAVARNAEKNPMFTVDERLRLINENVGDADKVEVMSFDGLLVDHARTVGASVLVRGLRAISDFEYEFQMAQMNRHLDDAIETIFLMPNQEYFYTSSRLVKQVAHFADRVGAFVPPNVATAIKEKFGRA